MQFADGDIKPSWLLAFDNWSSIMTGLTGLLGCIVSMKYMTRRAMQSASPRAALQLADSSHLKRHRSDLPDEIKAAAVPDSWEACMSDADMVSTNLDAIWFAEMRSAYLIRALI